MMILYWKNGHLLCNLQRTVQESGRGIHLAVRKSGLESHQALYLVGAPALSQSCNHKESLRNISEPSPEIKFVLGLLVKLPARASAVRQGRRAAGAGGVINHRAHRCDRGHRQRTVYGAVTIPQRSTWKSSRGGGSWCAYRTPRPRWGRGWPLASAAALRARPRRRCWTG